MSFLLGTHPKTGSPVIVPGQGPKLLLARERLRMQIDPSGISSLTRPAQALDGPIMPGTADIVRTAQEVTRGLGLDANTTAELEVALRRAADAGNLLAFRKLVMEATRTLAPTNMPLRAELSRRALLFYKHSAKPIQDRRYERLVVQKAGPVPDLVKARAAGWMPIPDTVHAGGLRKRHGDHWIYWYPERGMLSSRDAEAHEREGKAHGGHPGVLAAVGRGQGPGGPDNAATAARERHDTEVYARATPQVRAQYLAEPAPSPGYEADTKPPIIEPPKASPAIALHPDLWPDLDTLPPAPFSTYPNPAPLTDSEGKVRGYLSEVAGHVGEGMRRILGAWQHSDGVLLQDEAGLGKTNQALGAMVAHGGKRNLIVVPTAGKEGLMAQWAGPTAAGLFNLNLQRVGTINSTEPGWWIVSYDELLTVPKDPEGKPIPNAKPMLRPEIFGGQWDAVSFDESHNMVTAGGQRTIAGKELQERADKVIYMSATPFTNVADMHYLSKLGLWKDLIGTRPTKEDFPAVPRSGVIGTDEEAFAYWAHRAGAHVNRASYLGIKNPTSPLPMAALAAVLHVDGLSIKRMTSLEGVTSKFGVTARDSLTEPQREAFTTAGELCQMAAAGGINPMIVKALYVSWARQYWETLKVPEAIKLGKKALAEGKQVALYTSFKLADHRHLKAFPEMLRRRAERLEEKDDPRLASRASELRAIASDMDKVVARLPKSESAVTNLVNAFGGPGKVAEIHGNTSKNPQREQESYQGGQKHVVVATMAKGGTGISLHDTTGERPRVQINLSLPWSGREFNQVAGRSHRLGSKTDTTMHWLVGEDPNEKHNAAKVAARLRSMGALTTGDPESTASVKDLADFEFGNLSPDSDDAQDMVNVAEEMQTAIDKGTDLANPSPEAQEARDWFREYGQRRKAGHDVMGERFADAQLKRRAAEFRDARYAAQQLRVGKNWKIKWRPALKVFEVERGATWVRNGFDEKSLKAAGKLQTYGTREGVSFYVPPSGMARLAEQIGVHREKVDLRTAEAEHLDPTLHSHFDQLHDVLSGPKIQLRVERTGLGDVKITGNTYKWFTAGKWYGFAEGHRGVGGDYYYTMPEARLPELVERLGGTLPPEVQAVQAKAKEEATAAAGKQETIREATTKKLETGLKELGLVPVKGVSASQISFANTVRDKAIAQLRALAVPEAEEALRTVVQMASARTILDHMHLLGWRTPIDPAEVLMRLGVGKSLRLVVKAGGPFIGPRGGKWADAQHTESWVDPRQIQLPHHAEPEKAPEPEQHGPEHRIDYSKVKDPHWKRERTTAEAGGEMSRAQMRKDGWRAVGKSGDLHRHGYQVVIWVNPAKIKAAGNVPQASTGGELANKLVERGQAHGTVMYEYLPRPQEFEPGTDTSHMKRMTATNGDEQREVHRFVGAGMPNAGEQLPMFKSVTDADLEAIRPRLVLRVPAPGPWELLWLTEEVPDDLNKGAGHKYLKRLPTGKTKRRWRYIYALPDGSTVNSTELVPGSKFAITHLGKTGHFEVVGNNANGTVSVKHDETGRTIHLTQHDLGAWFTSHHARRTAEVTARAAHAKAAPALERGTIADLGNGGLDQVDGFSNDARELEVQASSMDASRQYLVIPQAGGFVLASRPRHAPTPGQALGEATQVFVRNDQGNGIRGLDAEYVVMESDKVIPSHDAMTFDKNPKYPEGVQERRYESIPSEQLKIERIANNLEPRLVANTNPDAINGTPVVNSDGVVLGGNGRTMGIQRAYIQYPERAAAMKQFLIHHAKAFGATPAHVAALKQPILVRRVHAGEDRAALTKLGRRMNEPLMQGLDPRSEEVAVSRFVTQEVVDSLTHHMEADQALGDFLSRPNSLPFVKDVEHAGIIDQYNRAKYLDEKTGLLNDDGKTRVTRVLAARMVPDADLLDAMPVSWRESLARATPYLLQAEHAGWDLRPALTAAAKLDREMQAHGFGRTGKDRRAFFGQMGLFGDTQHTPIVRTMLAVLQDHGDKVRSFPQGWKQVALEASRQSHDYGLQGALFKREPVTMEQAIDQAFTTKKPAQKELLAAEQEGEAAARRVMAYTRGEPGAQLALSMEVRKSMRKSGKRDALHAYLSQAVVWELQNQMRGALWAAGGEGHIDGAKVVTRLQEFVRDQARRDPVFARALGAHPLTLAVLRALVQAQGKANLASIVKALASHQMDLVKAHGPFIGPKGGKWADAAHTVSWHAPEAIQPLLQHEGPDLFAISMARPSKEHNFEYASTSKPNVPGTVHREVEGQWITYSKQPIKLDTVMEHGLAPLGQAAGHTVLEHAQRLRVPVELKARWGTADNPRAAALWPNPRVGWQMSHFDSHGASGHVESTDPVKLVNEAIREGYDQFEPGVVDKIVDPVKVAEMAARMAESDRQTREAREAYERAKQVAAQVGQHPAVVAMNQEAERPKLTVKDIKVGKPVTPKQVEYRQPTGTASTAREPLTSPAVQEWFKKPLEERRALLRQERTSTTGLPWDKSVQKSGGPFIGPKGGKWADAAHTESWRPEQATPPAAKPLTGKHKALLVAMAQRPNATLANGRVVPGSNTGAAIDKVSSTLGPRGHWHTIVRGLEARGLIHVYEKNSVASGSRFGRQQHDGYSVLTNEGKAALAKQGVDTGHVLTYEDNEAGNRAEQGEVAKAEVPVGTIHQWAIGEVKKVGPNQWEPVAGPQQPAAAEPAPAAKNPKLVVLKRRAPAAQQAAAPGTNQAQGGTTAPAGETKPAPGEPTQQGGAPTTYASGMGPGAGAGMAPAKVGVGAFDVPPPPPIPRLPGLPPEQAEAQEEFASDFEAHPDEMANDYLAQVRASKKPNLFSTDNAKMLSSRYNQDGNLPARGMFNLATHQVANAVAKKAFLSALDELGQLPAGDPKRTLLVTSGGVASGKGYALDNVKETKSLVSSSGAVWDAAGEQNATENPWILAEAEKRGLVATFVFVDADPTETWENPKRGVMQRAVEEGRMVDTHLYADSYADGARNFKAFYEANKDNPNAKFVFLENRGTPRLLDGFPEAALVNRGAVYQRAKQAIDSRAADLPPYVYQGGTMGRKVWGEGNE